VFVLVLVVVLVLESTSNPAEDEDCCAEDEYEHDWGRAARKTHRLPSAMASRLRVHDYDHIF
jgi:hypothetical protein